MLEEKEVKQQQGKSINSILLLCEVSLFLEFFFEKDICKNVNSIFVIFILFVASF